MSKKDQENPPSENEEPKEEASEVEEEQEHNPEGEAVTEEPDLEGEPQLDAEPGVEDDGSNGDEEAEELPPEPEGEPKGIAAFFEHPDHLMAAARRTRDQDYEEFDAYSPFPIHGMDEAMGIGRSWIPWVTFSAGLFGFICANALQFGTMTFDWPLIIGGKPFAPWPSFVPIMFELTVLIGGVTTALVMLKAAGCFQSPDIIDERITQDRFVLWISSDDEAFHEDEVTEFMEEMNPLEVRKVMPDK